MKQLIRLLPGILGLLLAASSCTPSRKLASATVPQKSPVGDYLQALLRFEPWAESVWKDDPKIPDAGYFGDGASTGNGGIRGTCGVALAYAVLVQAFPKAPQEKHRLKRVEMALRYAEETHQGGLDSSVTVDGKKWGVLSSFSINDPKGWQSSLWAASMGFAAALLEDQLDPAIVKGCKRVVAEEADWLIKKPPASGYKFDTKAEENAWQSNIVTLAAAWMPHDPRAKKWLRMAKSYLVNTYTVPADTSGALKKWITTQTLFPSFALENHGFYHPDYQMVAGMSLGDSYLMASMLNPKVAKEIKPFAEHNVVHVWQFLKGIILDSGELAFPSGLDWSLHSFEHVSYLAWMARHFKEPQAAWAEPRLTKQILYRQAVNGDGRFVGESCPDGFYREAVEARRIAVAYLQDQIAGYPAVKGAKPPDFVKHYAGVGLIIQRSDNTLTTVSYGPKTMALVYPLNGLNAGQRFIISPNTSTLIGGSGNTRLINFKKTRKGFYAELKLHSRQGRKSRMIVESTPDAVVFLEIPSDSSTLPLGEWLLTAVENDPLTGGQRTLLWKDHSMILKGRSGEATASISSGWINVDNWMGFVVPSGGNLMYRAAAKYNRNGAAEDDVLFKPDAPHQPRAVIVLPGKDAAATAKVMKRVKWKLTRKKCKLFFNLPTGKKIRITVPLSTSF